jgi:hypothetical protein
MMISGMYVQFDIYGRPEQNLTAGGDGSSLGFFARRIRLERS